MTGRQRRLHTYIWLVIAVVLPILMIMAVKDLSYGSIISQPISDKTEPATALVLEQEMLKTEIITASGTTRLQIYVKKPIQHPSALVYTLNDMGEKDLLLGQLEGVGQYSFDLPTAINGIVLYDAIRDMEIEKMTFAWD